MPALVTSCRLPSSAQLQLSARAGSGRLALFLLGVATRSRRSRSSRSSCTGSRRGARSCGRSLGRRCFHFLGTRMMDRDDRLVAPVREIDQRHARGQRNVRQALDVVDLHRREIDFEKFRQILRQAHDLHEVEQMRNHAALRLHAGRARAALEVQRDHHADLLVLQHALQVHVQDLVLRRVALHVLDDGSLRLVLDLQSEDRGEETLVHQQRQQVLVVEKYLARLVVPAIEDRRYFPGSAQAAARTLPLHAVTRIGDQFKRGLHV